MPDDTDYVLQHDVQDWLNQVGRSQWQTVYQSDHSDESIPVIFCALLTEENRAEAVSDEAWDFSIGSGGPAFIQTHDDSGPSTLYDAAGGYSGVRPFVLVRHFSATWPAYQEVCEEFRLLHNLAEDRTRGILIDFDDSGYEIEVVRFAKGRVDVRLDYLKRFLAATRLWVAVYIDSVRYSPTPFEAFDFGTALHSVCVSDTTQRYIINVSSSAGQTLSRLYGKVLIPPSPREACGFWPFEKRANTYVDFTIGLNDNGENVLHTCDPETLADFFGKNVAAPNYLTPVFFRREVLSKYYVETSRYTVSDGVIECHGRWHFRIDNNHPTHIVAFLGDLGRDLPENERLHWKQFNVLPEGAISDVDFARSFLAQATEPTSPDLVFRREYKRLQTAWYESHGWHVFLLPTAADEHLLRTVRIPITQSQGEFDDQVLVLTKLLVDSLNEAEFVKLAGLGAKDEKGISKFRRFADVISLPDAAAHERFLRQLQNLRSTGSGHRKGSQYTKALEPFGQNETPLSQIARTILVTATVLLRALRAVTTTAKSTA